MSQGDQKSHINQEQKDKMLDDLESLSKMLDEDLEDDEDTQVIPEDIPVLKSFVDDVPVLNESLEEAPPKPAPAPVSPNPEPPTLQETDSIDLNAAKFSTHPVSRPAVGSGAALDMSFLDKDPLDISERVRSYRDKGDIAPPLPQHQAMQPPAQPAQSAPAQTTPTHAAPSVPVVAEATATEVAKADSRAEEVTRPLNRFQTTSKTENPFLPRSTLDKIRENHAWEQNRDRDRENDASAQLRRLLQDNPLNKVTFDANSKEAQALRQKASQMVNEVIRANMPRLEAELRMKLEQEVDRMFKEIKKNPR
ncbi:MAG: hypothetical protein VYA55_09970 [Pseudomonadota bacterium]|nr:hypothetical protein [Pseudomonadota bacterium]